MGNPIQPDTFSSQDSESESSTLRQRWWRLMDTRIGIIPLPVLVVLAAILIATVPDGKFSAQLSPMIALLGTCSFACYELGRRIPVFRSIGGPVILVTFLPSYLVYAGIIPPSVSEPIVSFWKAGNFLYLFIPCIIVGSILSMDRAILVRGFLRIFVPLAIGSIVAAIVGVGVGVALGMDLFHTILFVVVPVMSGGLGEGVIPLTLGYADILHLPHGDLLAQAMPAVMLGNVCAIVLAGALSAWAKRRPDLTGNGELMRGDDGLRPAAVPATENRFDVADIAAAGMVAVCLYSAGMFAQTRFDLPGPVVMLVLAVIGKIGYAFSPSIERGAAVVYKFFASAVTYPLLFAIGVVITPWDKVVSAFNLPTLVTILATVSTMMAAAFVVGRKMNMHPIDTAIVVGTHTGMGGTGDVAILSAANRMQLMPFAQIATRIGGAITISITLIVLARLY